MDIGRPMYGPSTKPNLTPDSPPKIAYNYDSRYYWFLVSFSLLSVLLHVLPVSENIHNGLFTANYISLVGASLMMLYSPESFYNTYRETFAHIFRLFGTPEKIIDIFRSIWIFNAAMWLAHLLPVWWFNRFYRMGNPAGWVIIYLAFFGPYLMAIYPFDISVLAAIGGVSCMIVYGVYKLGAISGVQ